MPMAMIPMFSTEWYASSRFTSCWASAKATPSTAEAAPTTSTQAPQAGGAASKNPVTRRIP